LLKKKWLSAAENAKLMADVERQLEEDREVAVNSPMPTPESAAGGVYCEAGCHEVGPKYGVPKARGGKLAGLKDSGAAGHLE
ncbi:MAG: hypothetical protein LAO22_20575, partial [Acidobacteriia bacterium]|nr:hypothetical protein [Terriglobia bacterium]